MTYEELRSAGTSPRSRTIRWPSTGASTFIETILAEACGRSLKRGSIRSRVQFRYTTSSRCSLEFTLRTSVQQTQLGLRSKHIPGVPFGSILMLELFSQVSETLFRCDSTENVIRLAARSSFFQECISLRRQNSRVEESALNAPAEFSVGNNKSQNKSRHFCSKHSTAGHGRI